jgi:flagellar motor switch protein FliN/FliY
MVEQAASPLESMEMNDIGAALAGGSVDGAAAPGAGAGAPAAAAPAAGAPAGAKPNANTQSAQSLDFILDIPLKVTVELGRSKMAIRDILQLAQGSVVELSKFAGEPLEVLVNDKLIARGEVVVVNEKFGIRLTDILSPVERIEQLK